MKKPLIALAIIAALGLGYWLLSPLFINKEVQESLDPALEAQVNQAIEDYKENIEAQVLPEKMEEFKKQLGQMILTPDETMDEPMLEATEKQKTSEPVVLTAGSFVGVAHEGSGQAKVIDLGEKGMILRLIDLDVLNGPDLRVLLSKNRNVQKSADLGEYIELGKLKGNKGNQNYALPAGVDGNNYGSVIIYCKPFQVVFNAADVWGTESYQEYMANFTLNAAVLGDISFGWEVAGGSFESIIIDKVGRYDTFLNDRPLESGTWIFANGTLTLTSSMDEALNNTFTDLLISADKKTMQVTRKGKAEVWTR